MSQSQAFFPFLVRLETGPQICSLTETGLDNALHLVDALSPALLGAIQVLITGQPKDSRHFQFFGQWNDQNGKHENKEENDERSAAQTSNTK